MEERIYNPQKVDLNDLRGKSGVYQIRNVLDNSLYIGSSKDLLKRKRQHFAKLCKNKHRNQHLQNSFNKYGVDNFVFELIEFCCPEDRFKLEQYWLDRYFGKHSCFNILAKSLYIPSKKCIRKNLTGTHCREIVCVETGLHYNSIVGASRATGIHSKQISQCCLHKRLCTTCGYHFLYVEDYSTLSPQQINNLLQPIPKKHGNYKQVICLETRQIYSSVYNAKKVTGKDSKGILGCCNNRMNESGGLHWMYYEDFLKVDEDYIQTKLNEHNRLFNKYKCLETGCTYTNLKDIKKAFNTTRRKILDVLNGKISDINGYHFEFVN